MHCTDSSRRRGHRRWAAWMALGALAGCSSSPPPGPASPQAPVVQARTVPVAPSTAPAPAPGTPAVPASPASPSAAPGPAVARTPLPPMPVARNWDEFQTLAARRLVAANPQHTYLGVPPEPLLAIPVLEVELNGDGSVRRIDVLRHPGQARDTVQLAMDAVRRAAPFSEVSRLPRPWKFTEVFLYDDNRRFKPRTLDR